MILEDYLKIFGIIVILFGIINMFSNVLVPTEKFADIKEKRDKEIDETINKLNDVTTKLSSIAQQLEKFVDEVNPIKKTKQLDSDDEDDEDEEDDKDTKKESFIDRRNRYSYNKKHSSPPFPLFN